MTRRPLLPAQFPSRVWHLTDQTPVPGLREAHPGAQVRVGTWLPVIPHTAASQAGLRVGPRFPELPFGQDPGHNPACDLRPFSRRSFAKPPKQVQTVCECILIMKGHKELSWKAAKGMMSDPNFLRSLMEIDFDSITQGQVKNIRGERGRGGARFPRAPGGGSSRAGPPSEVSAGGVVPGLRGSPEGARGQTLRRGRAVLPGRRNACSAGQGGVLAGRAWFTPAARESTVVSRDRARPCLCAPSPTGPVAPVAPRVGLTATSPLRLSPV